MVAEATQPKQSCAACQALRPTCAPPGTEEKMEVMAFRAALNLPLCHPLDNTVIDWKRLEEELGGELSLRLRMENIERKHRPVIIPREDRK